MRSPQCPSLPSSSWKNERQAPHGNKLTTHHPPALALSRRKDNLGDGIDYGQQRRENLGELIMETLEAFEVNGGEDAFINIKYLVPVFQSVVVS